jgi:hypothetical protein
MVTPLEAGGVSAPPSPPCPWPSFHCTYHLTYYILYCLPILAKFLLPLESKFSDTMDFVHHCTLSTETWSGT